MNSISALTSTSYSSYWAKAISFEEYVKEFREVLEHENSLPAEHRSEYFAYTEMNLQRLNRSTKTFQVREDLMETLLALSTGYKCLVISEYWCGDAAQIVGQLAKIAEMSGGKIQIKFLFRDQNPELMDEHLTSGSRSIPMVILLDVHYSPVCTWGPRPAEAQELVKRLKANPETTKTYAEHLHKWYAQNKGEALQDEWVALLKSLPTL